MAQDADILEYLRFCMIVLFDWWKRWAIVFLVAGTKHSLRLTNIFLGVVITHYRQFSTTQYSFYFFPRTASCRLQRTQYRWGVRRRRRRSSHTSPPHRQSHRAATLPARSTLWLDPLGGWRRLRKEAGPLHHRPDRVSNFLNSICMNNDNSNNYDNHMVIKNK